MHWIAYASTETRPADVFVRPFQVSEAGVPGLGGGKWQVSKDGGNWPRWRAQNETAFLNGSVERAKAVAAVHTESAEQLEATTGAEEWMSQENRRQDRRRYRDGEAAEQLEVMAKGQNCRI